jgi:chemosensory pili system protein ChpA (sensor histidine kinase/response regulator)
MLMAMTANPDTMTDLAAESLELVNRELAATLDTARVQVESYIDGHAGREALLKSADLLHLARGALKIVDVQGAALLAEEMELTCRHLGGLSEKEQVDAGIEALTRAMVQLPAYIDRLMSGGSDIALVLLPLLNELRKVRGKPVMSEGTLLLLDVGQRSAQRPRAAVAGVAAQGGAGGPVSSGLQLVVHRLRPAFQTSLLGWIRGEQSERNLDELVRVSTALERASGTEEVQQLWHVLGAVLLALRTGGLESTVAIKRLVGQADRQLKRLAEGGEAALVSSPPVELLNNLLYYVARAESSHERLEAVRKAYGLTDIVPRADEIEQAREGLAGPSVKLMRTVAQAIKEDLATVKDVLDIFVRTGMKEPEQLAAQVDMLTKISDTLGVLGLEKAREDIRQEAADLNAIVAGRRAAEQQTLERIAASLLRVEEALDRELVRAVAPAQDDDRTEPEGDTQYRHVTQAVMGECIVNLAKIKEAVVELVDDPGSVRALDRVKPQLCGITAGLLMLEKTKAVKVVERIGDLIAQRLVPSAVPLRPEHLERLADAIVSVEYFMETVSAGRTDPMYMLDNAERCLTLLEGLPAARPPQASEPKVSRQEEPPAPAEKPAPVVMEIDKERSDPELLELFIEEAKEEIANIRRFLPAWSENNDDSEALIAVRRSFHTLKGSGRMVGAQLIGQFSWSIENLLNRLINQTLQVTPAVVEFIDEAAAALPQLVEQLEIGIAPRADVRLLMKRAEAFAEGDPDAASMTSESLRLDLDSLPEPVQVAAETTGGAPMDPVLAGIFVRETRGHLATIGDFLDGAQRAGSPHAVDESVYRAWHTLLGSARMANFEPMLALARPMSEFLGRCHQAGVGIGDDGLALIAEAVSEVGRMADALAASETYAENTGLIERLGVLSEPRSAAAAPVEEAAEEETTPESACDPEIAAIFTEEAAEILENAEAALAALREDPASTARRAELQRLLHTLKGGARMAGVSAMGDLSHALETLLAALAEGRIEPAPGVLDVVQRSFDELHRMRDQIDAGRALPRSADPLLLEQLEQGARGIAAALAGAETDTAAAEAGQDHAAVPTPGDADQREAATEAEDAELAATQPQVQGLIGPESEAAEPEWLAAAEELAEDLPDEEPEPATDSAEAAETAQAAVIPLGAEPAEPAAPTAPAAPGAAAAAERTSPERAEFARVDAGLLDALLNGAGEISIFQSRLNQQIHSVEFHLGELGQTVTRLREQLRKLEAETEAQILHRHQGDLTVDEGFDPLELDRYSTIQQLSRALAETASDVASINDLLRGLTAEADTLLTQQGRVTAQLQDGLMQTRMVPFQRHVSRLARIVRQAAADVGKSAELIVEGASSELDRQVLESMLPAFEHLLRNAVAHGIEVPELRARHGKPETGRVTLKISREGSEVATEVSDDGAGLDLEAVRRKALEQGLVAAGQKISDEEAKELILRPGFSTAGSLTQTAGRGVGMDVVDNEIKKLGGSLRIESTPGEGARFLIRLPYTLAITQALIVNVGDETFALPLPTVEGVTRVPREQLLTLLTEDEPKLDYGGVSYRVQHLGSFVGAPPSALPDEDSAVALVLVRAGEQSTALLTDTLEGSREIVVKTLGPHLSCIPGVSGATILGDGRVIIILDVGTLVRSQHGAAAATPAPPPVPKVKPLTALVVDDSITMRRVTQRLLERRGVRVVTARDGLDAIGALHDHEPDVILLDIEMPRMDGYQFAKHVRNDPKLADVPIIMITSRSGEKHRARAIEIGVNDYLSKPYQEGQLIRAIEALVGRSL